MELGVFRQRTQRLRRDGQIEALGLISLALPLQRLRQAEAAIILEVSLRILLQPLAKIPLRAGQVFGPQRHVAQVGQDVGVKLVVGVLGEELLQQRLGLVVLAQQIGRFARAEQRRPGVLAGAVAIEILLEVRGGLFHPPELDERLGEEKPRLAGPGVIGMSLEKRLEALGGEFPLLALILDGRHRIVVFDLIRAEHRRRHKAQNDDQPAKPDATPERATEKDLGRRTVWVGRRWVGRRQSPTPGGATRPPPKRQVQPGWGPCQARDPR